MMYRAKCTNCISQMANIYPNRRKNPMPTDKHDTYIKVDTEKEADLIEGINHHMNRAYVLMQVLEEYLEIEKIY